MGDAGGTGPGVNYYEYTPFTVAKGDYAANGGTLGLNTSFNGNNSVNDIQAGPLGASIAASAGATAIPYNWYLPPCTAPTTPGGKGHCTAANSSGSNVPKTANYTGVVWYRSQMPMALIKDGTSNVYLFGEKYMDQFNYTSGASGCGDEENLYVGMDDDNIRLGASGGIYTPTAGPPATGGAGGAIVSPYSQYLYPPQADAAIWPSQMKSAAPPGSLYDNFNNIRFGSAHAGGFNMAFCDGSIHTVIYEIDPTVHALLSDRQDGTPVDASPYIGTR